MAYRREGVNNIECVHSPIDNELGGVIYYYGAIQYRQKDQTLDTIGTDELRRNLRKTLIRVHNGESAGYTVTILSVPVGVLISLGEYKRLKEKAGETPKP